MVVSIFDMCILNEVIDVSKVPEGFIVRPLASDDYDNGYLRLLSQLTNVGEVSRASFETRFKSMANTSPKSYYVTVIEDVSNKQVVGSATLVLEWKFIHEAGSRGRIEDVVLDQAVRGKKLGGLLMDTLVKLGKKLGVYKMSLECKPSLVPFYERYGYKSDGGHFLVIRFDEPDSNMEEIPSNS